MTKEKLSTKQFFLIVNGPSCGGKSTTSKIILEKYGGIYSAQADHVKWLISDYTPEIHREIVHDMIFETMKVALKNGLSVLKHGALFEPEKIIAIAKDFNVPVFIANITAPKEILEKRFDARIEAKKNGARIANVDPKRFEQLYSMYLSTKMDSPLEFDSSVQTPEEIAGAICVFIVSELGK